MNTKIYKYKYEEVTDKLRESILAGEFGDGRLPREEDIVKAFNVSRITVLKAMNLLVQEGILTRVKGTGTFINRDFSDNATDIMHRTVIVAMPTSGHYYSKLYNSVNNNIQEQNLFPISYNINAGNFDCLAKMANLNTLLNTPGKGIILDGGGYWRNPDLLKKTNLHSIFVDYYDWSGKPPKGAVLIDYEYGAYLAAKHLLESGKKNLMLITNENTVSIEMSKSHIANHPRWQFNAGCLRAINEFPDATFRWVNCNASDKNFDLMASGIISKKTDGIICNFDYVATKLCSIALRSGLRVPDDIAFTGCYDTPWVYESEIPLTSIDVKPEIMGKTAIELLLSKSDEIIKLKPTLKIRQSSGPSNAKNGVKAEFIHKNNFYMIPN